VPIITILKYFAIAIAYLGLALGEIPYFRANRTGIALIGSAAAIVLGILNISQAWEAISAETIVFLLSIMIVNANLDRSGFFQLVIGFLLKIGNTPFLLLVLLTCTTSVCSALFLNDTIALIFTPLTLKIVQRLKLNPIPYLLALASATNIGSVATISGNPQNIIIGSIAKINYLEFTAKLLPIACIGSILQIVLLCLLYPQVRLMVRLENCSSINYRLFKSLFWKSLIITIAMLIAFIMGIPLAEAALCSASILLITRRVKPDKIFSQIDWNLLVMFSGLFVLSKAVQELHLVEIFHPLVSSSWGLLGGVAVLSNIISNVPAVLLFAPLIEPDRTQDWLLLAAGSTLAGNLTIFGSVANLIVVEAAAKLGYKLSFREHFRFGLPITLLTLLFSYFWLTLL
jgi:Na+/H+ antiporter NhaD/arsenite permease-like protein